LPKPILSQDCDIINCTAYATYNKALFLKIAHILQADLIGIDFICPNIEKSYKKQNAQF